MNGYFHYVTHTQTDVYVDQEERALNVNLMCR